MENKIFYTKSHEWVMFIDETTVRVGLTDYAQSELGDLVFVNLPEVGEEVEAGEEFADVESVKAVSGVYSPVSGTVKEVNEEVLNQPELINSKPMETWFIEVEDVSNQVEFLTKEEYEDQISKGE